MRAATAMRPRFYRPPQMVRGTPAGFSGDTIQAPTRGWNARDPLAEMKRGDAIILDNWYPTPTAVKLRNGYRSFATGLGTGVVDTVAEWAGPTSKKLFGFANNKIYDASSAGAASDVTAGSAITSNRWQTVNTGGVMLAVNGADVPRKYSGGVWADSAWAAGGLTQSNLIHLNVHRNRVYLIEKSTMNYYYSAVDAVDGAVTKVDLSTVFRMGGYLNAMATWSRDSNSGPLELAVFISSIGECLVYTGSYPGGTDWSLVSRFRIAPPIGRRCFVNIGGDSMIVTINGVVSLDKMGNSVNPENPEADITDRIQTAFAESAGSYGVNFGWDITFYPIKYFMLINIPVSPGATALQYVMNTQTGAWCRFTGMNAQSWTVYNDGLYFGGPDGTVYQADYGTDDNSGGIVTDLFPAFDYFGDRQNKKRFLMARPIIYADASVTFNADMETDFLVRIQAATASVSLSGGTAWDAGAWDSFDWAGGSMIFQNAINANGIGYCGALHLRATIKGVSLQLNATPITWETGGWL